MACKGQFNNGFGSRTVMFNCECCGHRTNNSADDRFCPPCFELLGIQNSLWDDGVELWIIDARDAEARKVKGDQTKLRAYMPDLFAATI